MKRKRPTTIERCCLCGTVNPFADLVQAFMGGGSMECRDEHACVRRQRMKMGKHGKWKGSRIVS